EDPFAAREMEVARVAGEELVAAEAREAHFHAVLARELRDEPVRQGGGARLVHGVDDLRQRGVHLVSGDAAHVVDEAPVLRDRAGTTKCERSWLAAGRSRRGRAWPDARRAFASDAKASAPPDSAQYSGLIPIRSRARNVSPVVRSANARANIPRRSESPASPRR